MNNDSISNSESAVGLESGRESSRNEFNVSSFGLFKYMALVGSVLTAIGGACLHLMGVASTDAYYKRWGLDGADFRLPTDESFIRGYEAITTMLSSGLLKWIKEDWIVFIFYGIVGLSSYVFINISSEKRDFFLVKLKRVVSKGFLRHSVMASSSFVIFTLMIPLSLVFVMFFALLPFSMAKQYGDMLFTSKIDQFKSKCVDEGKDFRCVTLRNNSLKIASGYFVGASKEFVALYDPVSEQVLLIERPGNIVLSLPFQVDSNLK